jgi:hypothetical protein
MRGITVAKAIPSARNRASRIDRASNVRPREGSNCLSDGGFEFGGTSKSLRIPRYLQVIRRFPVALAKLGVNKYGCALAFACRAVLLTAVILTMIGDRPRTKKAIRDVGSILQANAVFSYET